MGIFLRIVEGVFWTVSFLFGFHSAKILSRIILKEGFVCIIYTRSTRFNAPCFRVYRQRIWKAFILKFMIFETKICSFWVNFWAIFKPSILKQDKGVWFSGIEMPENAVRQGLSAFRFVILLRMIPNSYAVEAIFRWISRFLRIHLSVAVWWLKIKKF